MGASRLRTLKSLGNWCCNSNVVGSASSGCDICSINSSTCTGRGRGAGFGNFSPGTVLILLILLFSHFSTTTQESCPSGCECKWKSGKESVACARARLRAIPQGLDPNTQVLELPGNMIERLPSKVFLKLNLLNLQKIFLSECQLVSLETDTFAKLSNLIELELSGNRLSSVPSHTFDQIPELRDLKLNANPIVRISNDAFAALPRLIRLELTSCRIGTIDVWAFRGLPALQWLRLDKNRLLTIQAESFFPLRSLHGLEIAGNPWNCSCTLQPWRDWMLKNNVPFGIPPLCSYPKRLAGISWDRLQLEDFACLPKLASSTDQERISRVVEGENATLLCRLQTTPDTQIRWVNGNKGSEVVANGSMGTMSPSYFVLTESFQVKSGTFPYNDLSSSSSSYTAEFDEFGAMKYKPGARPNAGDRSLGVKISKLTIIRATGREAGLYICNAETKAGLVSANFTLHVVQTKTENLAGRVLFTGALVAALLLILVCLLLVCVVIGSRYLHFVGTVSNNLTTEEKIELNLIGHHLHNHDHEGQNGGSNIPLMRDHDGLGPQHDHEDDCKAIIIRPSLTNHYSNSQSSYPNTAAPPRPQRPHQLPNSVLARTNNNNSNGTRNNLGQNLTVLRHNTPEANHSVPPLSLSAAAATRAQDQPPGRPRRNGTSRDCKYKALPVNDPDDEEEDDDYDDNNSSNDGGGESGSDESSTPVVEIINNNHRRSKAAAALRGCRVAAESAVAGPPPFLANNGADSSRNIISSGSSSNSCSNNNNQHNHSNNINKRHSAFGASDSASAAGSGNNNNNNHASNCYESTGVTLATNTPIGMRSVVGTPQRKPATELSGSHDPFITSLPSTSYAQQQKQREPYHFQHDPSKDRYSELVNEKLPYSSIDYMSLPRPNKNRDLRVGSYFHRRNNSTDSQYPLLSSSYGRSLDGVSTSGADLLTPFASSSNPDSLAFGPPSPYAYHSRPTSTNYIYQPQHVNTSHPYLRHHSGSGQSLRNNSPGYAGAGAPPGTKWNQRLSMPTSPEKHFASSIPPSSYDYHAAQLAAFLEEYRILQMELIRMSSSLSSNVSSGDVDHVHVQGSSTAKGSVNLPNPSNNNNGSTTTSNNFPNAKSFVSSQQQQLYGLGPLPSEHRHPESGSNPGVTSNNSSRHTSPYKPRQSQQQPHSSPVALSSGDVNSANYFCNAAYGLSGSGAKPPVPARPPSLLSNATSNVLGPSEFQNKQNLKSMLKNPASIGGNTATGPSLSSLNTNTAAAGTGQQQGNAMNSNHNNNYDITFH